MVSLPSVKPPRWKKTFFPLISVEMPRFCAMMAKARKLEPVPTKLKIRKAAAIALAGSATAKANGTALLDIFHDADVRDAVADRIIDVSRFATAAVAA